MNYSTININEIRNNQKIIKSNYHLNDGKIRINNAIKNNILHNSLGSVTTDIYTGGIFKRIFVTKKENGLPYISAQIMQNSKPLEVAKLISKKYTPRQGDMTLQENQLLVSCAGTVGNVRLVTKDLDGIIGSQDIIRIIADNKKLNYGFLYAYLASPTVYQYIQSYIYGSVVPRIEPNTLSSLPVLLFSDKLIERINDLIHNSVIHRNKAYGLLDTALNKFAEFLPEFKTPKYSMLNISEIQKDRKRFDATFNIKALNEFYDDILNNGYKSETIEKLSDIIFTPNIFKRIRTKSEEFGVPYLGGAELLQIMPKMTDFLSKKLKNLDSYKLKKGWITVQDSGSLQTMGYVTLIPDYLDGVAATNNLVRIIPKQQLDYNKYIFAFLKTEQGREILKINSYGTGQLHIDNLIVKNLKIPIIPEIFDFITDTITKHIEESELSFKKENQAIELIENKISSWQK